MQGMTVTPEILPISESKTRLVWYGTKQAHLYVDITKGQPLAETYLRDKNGHCGMCDWYGLVDANAEQINRKVENFFRFDQ